MALTRGDEVLGLPPAKPASAQEANRYALDGKYLSDYS